MFLKKALLLYFAIALIFLIAIIILNSNGDKDRWLEKLPPEEQKLYNLERKVSITPEDLNMTQAAIFYKERQKYCHSFNDIHKSRLCDKRTLPWWDNLYKTQSNLHNIKE